MANEKILIVEDDGIIADRLQSVLTRLGFDVLGTVVSGEEALQKVGETRPDLLLMDIYLAGELDGVETAARIRAQLDVPVVYLTARSEDALLQQSKITEPYGYLIKPVRERELHATVEMALYRHELESRLKESERWLDTTLRSVGEAVIAADARGYVTFMNPVAEMLTGWQQAEALGKELTQVFHAVDEGTRALVENPVTRVVREGVETHPELGITGVRGQRIGLADRTLLIARDRTEISIDGNAAPIRNDKGTITGVVLVFRDVTEQVGAENQLRESEDRYRSIVELAPDGIVTVNLMGVVTSCNTAFLELTGFSKDEIVGRHFAKMPTLRLGDVPKYVKMIAAAMRGDIPKAFEFKWVHKDGTTRWGEAHGSLIKKGSKVTGLQAFLRDVTERKQTEEALAQRAVQLALLNNIGSKIAAVLELDSVLERAARLLQESFDYHHVGLFTMDHKRGELVMKARAGSFVSLFPHDHRIKLGQGMVGWVALHGESLLANDVGAEPRYVNFFPDMIRTLSELSAPIQVGGEIMGVLDVQSPQLNAFDENDVLVMETLANQIAAAIDNARLHKELKDLKEFHESIVQSVTEGIIVTDAEGRLSFVNPALATLLGYAPEELLGQPWMVVVPVDQQHVVQSADGRRARGQADRYDLELMHKDGTRRSALVSGNPRYDGDRFVGTLAILTDITERVRAEEALRESEEKHRTIIENIEDGYFEVDIAGNLTFFNDSLCRILGYPADELVGLNNREYMASETAKAVFQVFNQVYGTGKPTRASDWDLTRKDGTRRDIEASVSLIRDSEGVPVGFRGIARDVTERKQVEKVLRENEARFRQLAGENAQLYEQAHRRAEQLSVVNHVARAASATLRPDDLIETVYREIASILQADVFCLAFHDQGANVLDYRLIIDDGVRKPPMRRPLDAGLTSFVVIQKTPLLVRDLEQEQEHLPVPEVWETGKVPASWLGVPTQVEDRVNGVICVQAYRPHAFDEQERLLLSTIADQVAVAIENARLFEQVERYAVDMGVRVAERTRELAEANTRLLELDRLKTKFVSDVSHELRTPTANIKLYLHLLEVGKAENRPQYMSVLRGQADRLAELVQDILSLSRLDMGGERMELSPVDLNPLIEQVVATQRPHAESLGLELVFGPGAVLPPVRAQRNQLSQVVTNLLSNAINYTPSGRVQVGTYLDKERGQVCLEVQDTGKGIEPEDMPHIFDRFYRGKDVGSSNIPGTGLGLAIVKEIVSLYRGDISVESRPGEGSTFRVWLPVEGDKA